MMQVTVYKDAEGTYCFQVSGHSGYAESGSDIVCSAVSALTTNTVNSIETFTDDVVKTIAVNEEEGFLHYELETVSDASRLLLDSLVLGLESIEGSYGQFLKIRLEED